MKKVFFLFSVLVFCFLSACSSDDSSKESNTLDFLGKSKNWEVSYLLTKDTEEELYTFKYIGMKDAPNKLSYVVLRNGEKKIEGNNVTVREEGTVQKSVGGENRALPDENDVLTAHVNWGGNREVVVLENYGDKK